MEEMNNINVENTVTEIVEEATDKLTFGENCLSYALAGTFVVGAVTIGYLGYKGTKKLVNKIKNKKRYSEKSDEDVVDVESNGYHEVKDDETEED